MERCTTFSPMATNIVFLVFRTWNARTPRACGVACTLGCLSSSASSAGDKWVGIRSSRILPAPSAVFSLSLVAGRQDRSGANRPKK